MAHITVSNTKTHQGSTIIVASSTSRNKSKADYICTGTNDQNTINQAITALPGAGNVDIMNCHEYTTKNEGGTILLLEGPFNLTGAIDIKGHDFITIGGQGNSTVINNTATDGGHAISAINPSASDFPTTQGQNKIVIKNLLIQGNESSGDGIHFEETENETIDKVFSQGNGGHGIYIKALTENGGANNKAISNCQCSFNQGSGIKLEELHETLISNCNIERNYYAGVETVNTFDTILTGCSVEDNHGTNQIESTNTASMRVSNCSVEGDINISIYSGSTLVINNTNCSNLTLGTGTTTYTYLNNFGCSTLTTTTTSGSELNLNNGACLNMNIDVNILRVTNCTLTEQLPGSVITAGTFQAQNNKFYIANLNPTFNINNSLLLSNNEFKGGANNTITTVFGDYDNVKALIYANDFDHVGLTITGYNTNRHPRIMMNSNNIHSPANNFVFENANVKFNDNIIDAASEIQIHNSESLTVDGNTFRSQSGGGVVLRCDENCVVPMLLSSNVMLYPSTFYIVDSSGNLVVVGNVGVSDR